MALPSTSTIVQINAPTHLPTKLTPTNFPVWRKQLFSTLIGFDLIKYIDGSYPCPSKYSNGNTTTINAAHHQWFRQDQILISAILGSCSESIQPLLSSVSTSQQAWETLLASYAGSSRSRIIALKSKLAKNSKGTRSVTEFLQEMRHIADELALAQSPIQEEDLTIHILNQLGDEFNNIVAAIKVRETPIPYTELFSKLVDFERTLRDQEVVVPAVITANYTQRRAATNSSFRGSASPSYGRNAGSSSRRGHGFNRASWSAQGGGRNPRAAQFCNYCTIPGHDTRDCRKLGRFLTDNNMHLAGPTTFASNPPPAIHATNAGSAPSMPAPWILDSGASHHVTHAPSTLQTYSDYGGPDEVFLGNGTALPITHTGHTLLSTSSIPLKLNHILCVPTIHRKLISVAKLCKSNHVSVEFFDTHFLVKDRSTGAHLLRGPNVNDVYCTASPHQPQINVVSTLPSRYWHHNLGHPSPAILRYLLRQLGYSSMSSTSSHCESCSVNKSHKLPFGQNSFQCNKPLQLIYSDVWGPTQLSVDGYRFYVIFVDYYTKYTWLYPLKQKSDVATLFPTFKKLVEKYFNHQIVSIFSDNGGEYIKLGQYLASCGISHFTTAPHTPEQNGVAERRHRHIVETGLSLLHFSGLSQSYWSHAFQTAVYLINRLPTPVLHFHSPYQMLYHQIPNYTKLQPFGCLCYPWLRPYFSSKLHPKSKPCIFLGYSTTQSAYKCFDTSTNRLYLSRHVQFVQDIFPSKLCNTPDKFNASPCAAAPSPMATSAPPSAAPSDFIPPSLPPVTPNLTMPAMPTNTTPSQLTTSPPTTDPTTPHNPQPTPSSPSSPTPTLPTARPTRLKHPNPKYYNASFVNLTTKHPVPLALEPTTVTQAQRDPLWRQAMDAEFNAIQHNGTWELVPQTNQVPIGCKWIFRIKRKPDGSIDKYKARLVAKGFHQQPGKDYFETFSPVTKPTTIRVVLSLALAHHWPLRQMDVNNAFLHGTLQEDVYMVQPPGYVHPQFPSHICKLHKALYGLKQAPRAWYMELMGFLLQTGFKRSLSDHSLFVYKKSGILAYFLVYVDDIVLTGNDSTFLDRFVRDLAARFSIKDLGPLHHFLGIEVISTSQGLFLSQHRHIYDLLQTARMDGAKDVGTPLPSPDGLSPQDSSGPADPTSYRRLVGSLQYLAFTRPDISYAVNKLSRFMHAPTELHWQALKRVLRYLKGTIYHGLVLRHSSSLSLTAFSDSDWGGVHDGGRSTTAYVLYLGPNIISWRSSRQKSVSRSSTEAEYRALANSAAELQWLRSLLSELGIPLSAPPRIYCDNTGATYACANPVYHSRMKHLALDYHFVRELVSAGSLQVLHISTQDQIADVLTKSLPRRPFLRFRSKIGVSDGTSILRGHINHINMIP